jgi:hypothetical protein
VLGIVAVLIGQISLNMVLTQDAYQLRSLTIEKQNLATDVQIIQEEVSSLSSPQNLADAANMLGMVANPASVMIDIYNDKIFGEPAPARGDGSAVASANLVANSALGTVSEFSMATVADGELEVSVETEKLPSSGLVLQSGLIPASPTR